MSGDPLGGERRLPMVTPNGSSKRLADTESDTHGDANDKKYNDDLGDDAVATTETSKAVEPFACSGGLRLSGLLLPVRGAWPDLAIALVCRLPANTAWRG